MCIKVLVTLLSWQWEIGRVFGRQDLEEGSVIIRQFFGGHIGTRGLFFFFLFLGYQEVRWPTMRILPAWSTVLILPKQTMDRHLKPWTWTSLLPHTEDCHMEPPTCQASIFLPISHMPTFLCFVSFCFALFFVCLFCFGLFFCLFVSFWNSISLSCSG